MNFDQAIKAHTYWKITLKWLISGHRPLDAVTSARDDACELGHWLAGAGQAFAACPGFEDLVREHAAFHAAAGAVVRWVEAGQNAQAQAMMEPLGEFSRASERTIEAITTLQQQLQEGAATPCSAKI